MVVHIDIKLNKFERGFHIITDLIVDKIGNLPSGGVLHLFIKHTSAGLCINENCDPDVLADFESFFNKIVPENMPFLNHTVEGPDDMPAHVKSSMVGHSISIPIKDGKLMLGVWQGIYLCEFRNHASPRNLVATIIF